MLQPKKLKTTCQKIDFLEKEARKQGISNYRLAKKANVSRPYLSDIFNGNTSVGFDKLNYMANVLGYDFQPLKTDD